MLRLPCGWLARVRRARVWRARVWRACARRLGRDGEAEADQRAVPGHGLGLDGAAVAFRHLADDGEAEA